MSEEVFYQPRCVSCGLEHYVLNVPSLSRGESPCHNCGHVPPVFTSRQEWKVAFDEGCARRGH